MRVASTSAWSGLTSAAGSVPSALGSSVVPLALMAFLSVALCSADDTVDPPALSGDGGLYVADSGFLSPLAVGSFSADTGVGADFVDAPVPPAGSAPVF